MPFSSIFKGDKRKENGPPFPQAPGYQYPQLNYVITQDPAAQYPQPGQYVQYSGPSPPLPPREQVAASYCHPPPTIPRSNQSSPGSQPMYAYGPAIHQPAYSPPPTSLSPPPISSQRSASPQSYPASPSSLSPPAATRRRSPSPQSYVPVPPTSTSPGYTSAPQAFTPPPQTSSSHRPAVKRDPPKVRKILSLDGGGVRGLSIIKFLKYIMQELNRERGLEIAPLEPWQEFDMIGGTSTGG